MPSVVIIRDPKNRLCMGRIQHVLIEDRQTISWVSWLLASVSTSVLQNDSYLWPFQAHVARQRFYSLLRARHLLATGLLLSSLRAGGATHHYQGGMSIERLQFKGRWKSCASLQSYVQEAVASLVLLQLTPAQRPSGAPRSCSDAPESCCEAPQSCCEAPHSCSEAPQSLCEALQACCEAS